MNSPISPVHHAEQQRRYDLLVQTVADYAIYMLDLQGHVITWNAGAQRIKGYLEAEIIGVHFSVFFVDDDVRDGKPHRSLDTALQQGHSQDEGWRRRKDGSLFWAKVALDLIRDENGQAIGFAKVTRDQTERHEAERQLDQVRAELFHAQKLDALGQLTGGLAHDFNNLLTIILGSAKLALGSRSPERVEKLLGHIVDAGERGSQLTRQLLTFARHKETGNERFDLAPLLESSRALVSQALPKSIALSISLDPALHEVQADPTQLQMVVLNLVFNARDAIDGEGNIHISASNVRLDEAAPGLQGEFVRIRVSDTGSGIDEHTLARMFEPFFTTKAFGHGTGLGLSQAYGFARQLRGDLRVSSELGRGTCMSLLIPSSAP
jgi:PAS domain S-box-containing protein